MNRPLIDGFSLVWRHQRLVWWIFFVNLFLGFLASIAPRVALHSPLDKSFYSQQLSQHFDVTVFMELLTKPEVSLTPAIAGSAVVGFIFVFYMLFLSGGIVSVYNMDRKLTRGEFFESCGTFFWRLFRLLLCSVIPFGVAFALYAKVQTVSGKMASDAAWELQGFWVHVAGAFLCLLMILFVRAWFDLAQASTVREDVRGMFFLTWRAFVLALRNAPRFVFMYFVVTIIGALLAIGSWLLWLNIPHQSFGASWLLLELLSLFMIGLRLWQRAAIVLWYDNYAAQQEVPVLPPLTPLPLPHDFVVTEPVLPPLPDDSGQRVT
jgi:hypothetical protein